MSSERLQKLSAQLGANATSDIVINGVKYNTGTEPKVALAGERANSSFDIEQMTYFLHGGEEKHKKRADFMDKVERNPAFHNNDYFDLDHETLRAQTMARVGKVAEYLYTASDPEEAKMRSAVLALVDTSAYTRTGVHYGLFISGLQGSATDDQFRYWVKQGAFHLKKFAGCFGMTELGHGSNVAGVETTATFDKDTDEFVINTPHVGATKWWIGGAAHTCTHCLVYARLIVDGKDHGVKNFVVPLRNVDTFALLQGVAVGDIGKKMGRDGIDNGWIQFSSVRIPRQYMCMRYSKVDRDGNVTEPPLAQLSYGALVGGRVSMVADSFYASSRFLTIALRYAAVRRQFGDSNGVETKILDYRYHQRRLIPRLAYSYAMGAASEILGEVQKNANQSLTAAGSDKEALSVAIEDTKELFALSAGLKAFSTWGTAQIIDECRQACGGQGYSAYSGFGPGYNDWVVQCTWEGDNNVLTLSAGRALIQTGRQVLKGKQPGKATEYLTRAQQLSKAKLGSKDLASPAVIIEAWEAAATLAVMYATQEFVKLTKQGVKSNDAFEQLSQLRFDAARIHTRQFVVKSFFEKIDKKATGSIKPVLLDVATLFGLWSIEQEVALFIRSGYLSTADAEKVTRLVDEYCLKVREQAIPLSDAFGLSDFFINSSIGKYDGDVFNNILNITKSHDKYLKGSKPPYFETVTKPFLTRTIPKVADLAKITDL